MQAISIVNDRANVNIREMVENQLLLYQQKLKIFVNTRLLFCEEYSVFQKKIWQSGKYLKNLKF